MQCPECGRFLSNAFVAALTVATASCPGCEEDISADALREVSPTASIRPPDLAPEVVRDAPDVLADWDVGVSDDEIASWRRDRRPFPTDTVVVAVAGLLGALAGGVLGPGADSRHRARPATLGALVGIAGAAGVRRVWRLSP